MLNNILNIYLFLPFIIALFLGIALFIKKISIIDNIVKIYGIINFIFSCALLVKINTHCYNILNINFEFNSTSSIFVLLASLVFLFFIFISKDIILKLNRLFYCALITLCGLINLFILSDSVFLNLAIILWFLLISYVLTYSFCEKKEEKKNLKIQLINDFIIYFLAIFLICYNFIEFFISNNILLNFSNIKQSAFFIDRNSMLIAFLGFSIIIFRLFNFIFFSYKSIRTLKYINNFISSFVLILSLLLGNVLLIKIFTGFDSLFYQYRNIACFYFIFNFIYYIILSVRENSLIRFCAYNLCSFVNISLLVLFSLGKNTLNISLYYFFTLILSYVLVFLICTILENKMKVKKINELKRLKQENKKIKALVLYSFLNILNVPFLGLFTPFLICLLIIFSTDYNSNILNYSIYIIALGCFLSGCSILNILNGILIEPLNFIENKLKLSNIQIFIFAIVVVIIILLGIISSIVL